MEKDSCSKCLSSQEQTASAVVAALLVHTAFFAPFFFARVSQIRPDHRLADSQAQSHSTLCQATFSPSKMPGVHNECVVKSALPKTAVGLRFLARD